MSEIDFYDEDFRLWEDADDALSLLDLPFSLPPELAELADVMSQADDWGIEEVDKFLEMFGEPVTYHPDGGDPREIQAIVIRQQIEGLDVLPHGNAPMTKMFIANDSAKGISSDEIDLGGDKIEYEYRIGNAAQQCRITEITETAYDWLVLEIR